VSVAGARLEPGPEVRLDDYPVDLAWSPDGRQVVVAGGEGRLHIVSRGDATATLRGEQLPGLLAVVWQPGGTLIATAGQDGGVRLWDASAGDVGTVIHRGMQWPLGLGFEPRGKALAFATGRTVRIFGVDGTPRGELPDHDVNVTQLAWRTTTELVAAGNGALFVDRLAPDRSITKYTLDGAPLALAISPDGRVAASGLQDGMVAFRNLIAQKRSRMSGYDGKVALIAWSANSRYLATASTGGRQIIVWDFSGKGPEGTEPMELHSHTDRVESLAYAPDGAWLASGGRDGRVVLWKPGPAARGGVTDGALDVQPLAGPVSLVRWSRDGRHLAVAQADGRLCFFALKT
jgi:WD40 repeat protein